MKVTRIGSWSFRVGGLLDQGFIQKIQSGTEEVLQMVVAMNTGTWSGIIETKEDALEYIRELIEKVIRLSNEEKEETYGLRCLELGSYAYRLLRSEDKTMVGEVRLSKDFFLEADRDSIALQADKPVDLARKAYRLYVDEIDNVETITLEEALSKLEPNWQGTARQEIVEMLEKGVLRTHAAFYTLDRDRL